MPQLPLFANETVRTEEVPQVEGRLRIYVPGTWRPLQSGQLPKVELFYRHRALVWQVLVGMMAGRNWRDRRNRAAMVMQSMMLQAHSGKSFASAAYIASVAEPERWDPYRPPSAAKTWQRTLGELAGRGLCKVSRLARTNPSKPGAVLSVNLVDWTRLWMRLIQLISQLYAKGPFQTGKGYGWEVRRIGKAVSFKVGGLYIGQPLTLGNLEQP